MGSRGPTQHLSPEARQTRPPAISSFPEILRISEEKDAHLLREENVLCETQSLSSLSREPRGVVPRIKKMLPSSCPSVTG